MADPGGAWTFKPTLGDGQHTIAASESYGAIPTASASLTFSLATEAPSIGATESASGQSQTSDAITASATAENVGGDAIAGVEICDGSADLGAATRSNGYWTFTAQNVFPGTNNFTARATDFAGSMASFALPQVTITPNLSVLDTTTSTPFQTNGTGYSGPVAGLQWEYIYTGRDNLSVTANVANVFIHTGSGEDAIDVNHAGGNNVPDGSTGSNFLVGGSGDDTFFVNDRSPSADIWSTVTDFQAGDAATIFGISQIGFHASWINAHESPHS